MTLADTLVDDFDVVDVLSLVTDRCVALFDVDGVAVMLAAPDRALGVVASSNERLRLLEVFETRHDEGPSVDAYRSGRPSVRVELSEADDRWPRFAPEVTAAGFRSVHSRPLRLRDRTIGALTMFRFSVGALDPADLTVAQGFADLATITVINHRSASDAQTLNNGLLRALDSRISIEQAKGRLSEATGVTMDEAFTRLRDHARRHYVRLADLSRDVATGATQPRDLDPLPGD